MLNYAIRAAEGVRYLHTQVPPIIHRDIKTMNFLVGKDDDVRVADFGLARSIASLENDAMENPVLTDYVATRWYRAPEILLGSTRYGRFSPSEPPPTPGVTCFTHARKSSDIPRVLMFGPWDVFLVNCWVESLCSLERVP